MQVLLYIHIKHQTIWFLKWVFIIVGFFNQLKHYKDNFYPLRALK